MNQQHPYHVYILWSDTGRRFYTGVTEDVIQRLSQHNAGASRWTSRYAGSWQLVWQRQFSTLGEARSYETLLKRQKRGSGFFSRTGLDPTRFLSQGS